MQSLVPYPAQTDGGVADDCTIGTSAMTSGTMTDANAAARTAEDDSGLELSLTCWQYIKIEQ